MYKYIIKTNFEMLNILGTIVYNTFVFIMLIISVMIIINNVNTYIDPKGTLIFKPFRTQVSVEKCLKAFEIHIANSYSTWIFLVFISAIFNSCFTLNHSTIII